MPAIWRRFLQMAVWLLLLGGAIAHAHRASDAYLDVRSLPSASDSRPIQLQLAIALRDLDAALPIDADADRKITWAEVDGAASAVLQWVTKGVQIDTCAVAWQFAGLERRSDGTYAVLQSRSSCPSTGSWVLRYELFKGIDATHRLIVTGRIDGADVLTAVSPGQPEGTVLRAVASGAQGDGVQSGWQTLVRYSLVGAHHLLEGVDHMAFLLALVLPLHLSLRRRKALQVADSANAPTKQWSALLLTVTAFTVGHSITLGLAVLGIMGAPPVWVEPMIAVSIGVSALLNIYPVRFVRGVHLAFGCGLIHGMAFAGLLIEAAAPAALLPWALAGFNLGVEAGQLLAVCMWVLLSQVLIHRQQYTRWVVPTLSWVLVAVSVFWFFQRV